MEVPSILLSGNHKEINDWRKREMINRTSNRRNDLILSKGFKNSPLRKRIKKDKKQISLCIENEYENYPDW